MGKKEETNNSNRNRILFLATGDTVYIENKGGMFWSSKCILKGKNQARILRLSKS